MRQDVGGQLIATKDITAIGRYGPGQLTVSNASVWLTNVSVGRHSASTGTLNVQSAPGEGTRVELVVPLPAV